MKKSLSIRVAAHRMDTTALHYVCKHAKYVTKANNTTVAGKQLHTTSLPGLLWILPVPSYVLTLFVEDKKFMVEWLWWRVYIENNSSDILCAIVYLRHATIFCTRPLQWASVTWWNGFSRVGWLCDFWQIVTSKVVFYKKEDVCFLKVRVNGP